MVILIDNGHGSTSEKNGKFSPLLDESMKIGKEFTNGGRFREWKYNRVISNLIVDKLVSMGYDARLVVTEDEDISLSERVKRINKICNKYGAKNVLLVSIHSNAKGNGTSWQDAKGWEAYSTKGKTKSDMLAEFLYKRAHENLKDRRIREDLSDGDMDKESNFYIISKSYCPAVLTENFFYDNKDDLKYLTSDEGVHCVVRLHVEGIIDYISEVCIN